MSVGVLPWATRADQVAHGDRLVAHGASRQERLRPDLHDRHGRDRPTAMVVLGATAMEAMEAMVTMVVSGAIAGSVGVMESSAMIARGATAMVMAAPMTANDIGATAIMVVSARPPWSSFVEP